MKKLKIILATSLILLFVSFLATSCDRSKTLSATVIGVSKTLSAEEKEIFKSAFGGDIIVDVITDDNKVKKAAMCTCELKGRKFPFKAKIAVCPDGLAFVE